MGRAAQEELTAEKREAARVAFLTVACAALWKSAWAVAREASRAAALKAASKAERKTQIDEIKKLLISLLRNNPALNNQGE